MGIILCLLLWQPQTFCLLHLFVWHTLKAYCLKIFRIARQRQKVTWKLPSNRELFCNRNYQIGATFFFLIVENHIRNCFSSWYGWSVDVGVLLYILTGQTSRVWVTFVPWDTIAVHTWECDQWATHFSPSFVVPHQIQSAFIFLCPVGRAFSVYC